MLQVTSNYSKIFANCRVDLYTGNTFNDAISCFKMRIDLYTGSPYTRVYTISILFLEFLMYIFVFVFTGLLFAAFITLQSKLSIPLLWLAPRIHISEASLSHV